MSVDMKRFSALGYSIYEVSVNVEVAEVDMSGRLDAFTYGGYDTTDIVNTYNYNDIPVTFNVDHNGEPVLEDVSAEVVDEFVRQVLAEAE